MDKGLVLCSLKRKDNITVVNVRAFKVISISIKLARKIFFTTVFTNYIDFRRKKKNIQSGLKPLKIRLKQHITNSENQLNWKKKKKNPSNYSSKKCYTECRMETKTATVFCIEFNIRRQNGVTFISSILADMSISYEMRIYPLRHRQFWHQF